MKNMQKFFLIAAAASLSANAASASQVNWTGASGMSAMNNPNTMADIGSTVLASQASALQNEAAQKQAQAAAAQSAAQNNPVNELQTLLTQNELQQTATAIENASQGGGHPPAGTFTLSNGETGSYGYNSGTGATTVTIGGTTFTIQ